MKEGEFTKLNGHVFSPLMEYVKDKTRGEEMPKGWNAKSRCTPQFDGAIKDIGEELWDLEKKVKGAAQKAGKMKEEESGTKTEGLAQKPKTLAEEEACGDGEQLREAEVWEPKKDLEDFIIAPVDEKNADGAVM